MPVQDLRRIRYPSRSMLGRTTYVRRLVMAEPVDPRIVMNREAAAPMNAQLRYVPPFFWLPTSWCWQLLDTDYEPTDK